MSADDAAVGPRASVAASLAASVSSGRAALGAARHKNWRASYLRALNIYPPEVNAARGRVPVPRPSHVHARPRGRRTEDGGPPVAEPSAGSRSSRSSGASSAVGRLLGRRSGGLPPAPGPPGASPPEDKGGYVFGMRAHLFRARRPARPDVLVVDRVSAPIAIRGPPGDDMSATGPADREGTNQTPQLLSWEEPAVMLGDHRYQYRFDPRLDPRLDRHAEPEDDSGDDGRTEDLDAADDDDDIFKMDALDGDDDKPHPWCPDAGVMVPSVAVPIGNVASRRRGSLPIARPRGDNQHEDARARPLSESFVPPHQLVQRGDCFSLGLRDELKRRPQR